MSAYGARLLELADGIKRAREGRYKHFGFGSGGERVLREAADALEALEKEHKALRALCLEAAALYGSGGVFPVNGDMSARLELAGQGMRLALLRGVDDTSNAPSTGAHDASELSE